MKKVFQLAFLSLVLTSSILGVMYIAAMYFTYTNFFQALAALIVPPALIIFLALHGCVK